MIHLPSLGSGLTRREDGVWVSARTRDVSYPSEGHASCFGLEDTSFWFRHRNECILAALEAFPPGVPLLDVGAGNGFVARALIGAGYPTVALEAGGTGAANARARGLDPVVWSALEDCGFRPGSFGAAGLFDVLEHVPNPRDFLRGIRALLAPNGRIYVTVPAGWLLWSAEDRAAGHYRRYGRGTLRRDLAAAGFSEEYSTGFFVPLMAPILLLRALPSGWGRRGTLPGEGHGAAHSLPDGPLGRWIAERLRREVSTIRARRELGLGASRLYVGRAR